MSRKKHRRNKNKKPIVVSAKSFNDKQNKVDSTTTKQAVSAVSTWKGAFNSKPCHPVTEIVPNLFLGGYSQVREMVTEKNVDVLVPLDSLDGNIWKYGFRGEILYYPIQDFGTLPSDVYETVCNKILECIKANKKVGLFCMGGHGRTGYVAAGVLGLYGIEDPINLLWTKYCEKAVETTSQLEEIAVISNNMELYDKYKLNFMGSNLLGVYGGYGGFGYGYGAAYDYDWGSEYLFKGSSVSKSNSHKDFLDDEKDGFDELEDLEDEFEDEMSQIDRQEKDDAEAYLEWWKKCAHSPVSVHDVHSQGDINDPFGFDDGSGSFYK